jgi:hypothetical protein
MNIQQTQIFLQLKPIRTTRRIDDEIKCHLVREIPVFILGSDVAIGAHGFGICFFRVRARNHVGFCAEGFGEEETEVSDSSQSDDSYFLSGAGAVADERGAQSIGAALLVERASGIGNTLIDKVSL